MLHRFCAEAEISLAAIQNFSSSSCESQPDKDFAYGYLGLTIADLVTYETV